MHMPATPVGRLAPVTCSSTTSHCHEPRPDGLGATERGLHDPRSQARIGQVQIRRAGPRARSSPSMRDACRGRPEEMVDTAGYRSECRLRGHQGQRERLIGLLGRGALNHRGELAGQLERHIGTGSSRS